LEYAPLLRWPGSAHAAAVVDLSHHALRRVQRRIDDVCVAPFELLAPPIGRQSCKLKDSKAMPRCRASMMHSAINFDSVAFHPPLVYR
jgi:hypothetical protein